jgi:thiosulfate reductase cytochrome b subunit
MIELDIQQTVLIMVLLGIGIYLLSKLLISYLNEKKFNGMADYISSKHFNELDDDDKSYYVDYIATNSNNLKYSSAIYMRQKLVYLSICFVFSILLLVNLIKMGINMFVYFNQLGGLDVVPSFDLSAPFFDNLPLVAIFTFACSVFYRLYLTASSSYLLARIKENKAR